MTNDFLNDFSQEPFEPDTYYEFCINGRLDQDILAWFGDMTLSVDDATSPPRTFIRGVVRDQAAFYGLISRFRDLGLALISVNRVEKR